MKPSSSLHEKQSESSSGVPSTTTPSDQKPREIKSAPYADPSYPIILATKGGFMEESELGITDASKSLGRALLERAQTVPEDSFFRDDLFHETCRMVRDRNEAKVIQDIARLIVPAAQSLAIHGATALKILIESVNEGWNNSIPMTGTRP